MKRRAIYVGLALFTFAQASFAETESSTRTAEAPPRIFLDRMIALGGAVSTTSAPAALGGLGGLGVLGPVGMQALPFGGSWVSGATRNSDGQQTRSLRVAPSADFRVSKNILLGGALGASHTTLTMGNAAVLTGYRFASWAAEGLVRVGYMAELGQGFLLVPRVGLGAEYGRTVFRRQLVGTSDGGTYDALAGRMETDVSLLVPLRGPVYLSAGPSLRASTLINANAEGAGVAVQSLDTLSFGASAGLTAAF